MYAASVTCRLIAQEIDFDRQVAPVITARCLECHGGTAPEGGLSLIDREIALKGGESGDALIPGDAAASVLIQRVRSNEMPPKRPLSAGEKAILEAWVAQGAKWGSRPLDLLAATNEHRAGRDWWSLVPLQTVSPPPESSDSRGEHANHPIDRFLRQRLDQAGLRPTPPASPRALLRRLHFDLIGLPPTPEEIDAFTADPSDATYRKIVDELLASPRYGERWGRHWLDVVRFGESDGFERNFQRENAWPYRDWVIGALNADMPYDEFVRMQLMGDLLAPGPDGVAATGFWVAGLHNTVVGGSERMKQLARQDELEDVIGTVGQTFLGLTLNCARCHDHKFDPVTQLEYYRLVSAISGLGFGDRDVPIPGEQEKLKSIDERLKTLSAELTSIDETARTAILEKRKAGTLEMPAPPRPFAAWEFDSGFDDSRGELHGRPVGNARVENGALMLDGQSFVETPPLPSDVSEKTLEAWIQVDGVDQRGGAAISLETLNGGQFDAIVFGENEPKRWMAGSNGFVRTESFGGTDDPMVGERPVHVAIVYRADGTILGYRDGVPYGKSIRKGPLAHYKAGEAELVFGLRHKPAGGNRHLNGRIHRAAFYDRALSAEEVAHSAGRSGDYVSESHIEASLNQAERARRATLKTQVAEVRAERKQQAARSTRKMYSLAAKPAPVTRVLLRGDPDRAADVASPGSTSAMADLPGDFGLAADAPEADRRRKLTEWITHRKNPLFARVIVNRVWHYHFGTGLVDTPSDFGFNGGRPSHPELLDDLASKFLQGGMRLKALHRLIVTSSAYRRSTSGLTIADRERAASIDVDNRLLWRGSFRRLEAEAVRDAILSSSGRLNLTMGGPGFKDVSITLNSGTTYFEPIDVEGPEFWRRTVYRFNPRGERSTLLDTFDCPDPAATAPRRSVTATPLQALSLLNNSFVLKMSEEFARRVEAEAGPAISDQVSRAWRLAVGRLPEASERRLSEELAAHHGMAALCRGLFNLSEFVILD